MRKGAGSPSLWSGAQMVAVTHTPGNYRTPSIQGGFEAIQGTGSLSPQSTISGNLPCSGDSSVETEESSANPLRSASAFLRLSRHGLGRNGYFLLQICLHFGSTCGWGVCDTAEAVDDVDLPIPCCHSFLNHYLR